MTSIEWTDQTWNPVAGCNAVSPGCTNCYAMRMAARLAHMGTAKYQGTTRKSGKKPVWTGKVSLDYRSLLIPYGWKKPRMVFVNSMSDLFHDDVPDDFILTVWKVMSETPKHTYQILTKRPERMRLFLQHYFPEPLSNVWLGTSIENTDYSERARELRETPSKIRFISFEPLLGSVGNIDLDFIDWVIVGGESGPGARPIDEIWVQEIFEEARRSNTKFFFKQWGGLNKKKTGRVWNGKTWDETPIGASS